MEVLNYFRNWLRLKGHKILFSTIMITECPLQAK